MTHADTSLASASTRVPAEFRGRARAFINGCKAAQLRHADMVNMFGDYLAARHRRHPERGIPARMLEDICQRWQRAADPYRISFVADIVRTKGTIVECRPGLQGLIHAPWADVVEQNLMLLFVSLAVTRSTATVATRAEHSFSLHALSRWYQRSGLRDDADLLAALTNALIIEPEEHIPGTELTVPTECGAWKGVIKQPDRNGVKSAVWCGRTWLEDVDV